jgi:hypothetical protein
MDTYIHTYAYIHTVTVREWDEMDQAEAAAQCGPCCQCGIWTDAIRYECVHTSCVYVCECCSCRQMLSGTNVCISRVCVRACVCGQMLSSSHVGLHHTNACMHTHTHTCACTHMRSILLVCVLRVHVCVCVSVWCLQARDCVCA